MIKIILSLMLVSSIALAECKAPVTYLTEGKATPCNGYLFTPEKELEVRNKVQDLDNYIKLSQKQDVLISTLNERVTNQSEQNINLRNSIESRDKSLWIEQLVYFSLGVLIGGFVGSRLAK